MGIERRVYPRAPADFLVAYNFQASSGEAAQEPRSAMALDISEGGMAFLTSFQLPSSSDAAIRLKLEFDLAAAGETRTINAVGEVRYCYQLFEEGKWRVGLQFMEIKQEDKALIADFVRSFGS